MGVFSKGWVSGGLFAQGWIDQEEVVIETPSNPGGVGRTYRVFPKEPKEAPDKLGGRDRDVLFLVLSIVDVLDELGE